MDLIFCPWFAVKSTILAGNLLMFSRYWHYGMTPWRIYTHPQCKPEHHWVGTPHTKALCAASRLSSIRPVNHTVHTDHTHYPKMHLFHVSCPPAVAVNKSMLTPHHHTTTVTAVRHKAVFKGLGARTEIYGLFAPLSVRPWTFHPW